MITNSNPIIMAKNAYEARLGVNFSPNEETLIRLGFRKKRLTRILSGKTTKPLSAIEAKGLAEMLNVPVSTII